MLADVGHVWELQPDGTWHRRSAPEGATVVDAQEQFMRQALASHTVK